MKVLTLNCSASSLKFQLFNMKNESVIVKGVADRVGMENAILSFEANGLLKTIKVAMPTHTEALNQIIQTISDKDKNIIKGIKDISAFGHFVSNVGEKYFDSVIITPEILDDFKNNKHFSPFDLPNSIMGIEACFALAPKIKNIAVFDTGFHSTIPSYNYRYAIPKSDYEEFKIRKYGAQGISHKYVSQKCLELLKGPKNSKIITCHLGMSGSVCAVINGKSYDTSMGFSMIDGIIMGTKSGSIDAAAVAEISSKRGFNSEEVVTYLNKKSGLLGLCGLSDLRDIEENLNDDNVNLAFEAMCASIVKYIGAYTAIMGGVDAIVFTAGIGERSPKVRGKVLEGLGFLGVEYDNDINQAVFGELAEISSVKSKVKVYVIPTKENLTIARETYNLVKKK